ncbi:MAG: hypothetical protein COB66_05980 [Coxiella sp. (in: Bacteria)]|nr:MAG: hypothetical protein COB66_05980 [Coxiella sp. (in: g-proteobacteria)]
MIYVKQKLRSIFQLSHQLEFMLSAPIHIEEYQSLRIPHAPCYLPNTVGLTLGDTHTTNQYAICIYVGPLPYIKYTQLIQQQQLLMQAQYFIHNYIGPLMRYHLIILVRKSTLPNHSLNTRQLHVNSWL